MSRKIKVKRLRGGTLLRLLLIGNFIFFIPLSIIIGILGFFGLVSVNIDDKPVTGLTGIISSLFAGLWTALFLSIFIWGTSFLGLWFYSKFRSIELGYIPVSEEEKKTNLEH